MNGSMLERLFRLTENQTTALTEVLAGLTTFLTMAYIHLRAAGACSTRLEHLAFPPFHVAAPGDGRTPLNDNEAGC